MEKARIKFDLIENEEAKTVTISYTHNGVQKEEKSIFLKSQGDFEMKVLKYFALSSISELFTNESNNA